MTVLLIVIYNNHDSETGSQRGECLIRGSTLNFCVTLLHPDPAVTVAQQNLFVKYHSKDNRHCLIHFLMRKL